MEPIESIEQYKSLKAAAKQRCGNLASNFFLTSGGLSRIMELQGLSYVEYPQGLVLFTDEGSYYRVFYFLDPDQPLPDLRQDKKVVIEELDNNGKRDEYLNGFFAKLEAAGWERIARNVQVYSSFDDRDDEIRVEYNRAQDNLKEQGFHIEKCSERHVDRVVSLWREWLHETDLPREHIEFFGDPSQVVICVLDENDEVCGTNWWKLQGGVCEIRHTVTDPRFYKRGIGYAMQLAAMVDALDNGSRGVFTYIDDRNYRSLAMFRKAGVLENGRTTVQYSLERSNNGQDA